MSKPRTVRDVEIAELLGVSKQRAHQIADEDGFPAPVNVTDEVACGPGDAGVGEGVASLEAVALGEELEPLFAEHVDATTVIRYDPIEPPAVWDALQSGLAPVLER